ncbi:polypyrimidine tract-binding protein homolog 1 isoform X1 [Cajanus cajan]|uniref:polypyrimidine tract-binding protein homolog 1 isoform X1 n=1 Tax=Cajanus cajan TaxID=3821 RepID=UPI00098DB217|nr:polypyrimidine tract-binding protein homolog 1 isoform X1 [Cajanus cajan]
MSTSSQQQFRYTQTPSKVLHLRNLPWECSEDELRDLCKPFGKIVNTKCNVGANRNQAFVEFADLNQAISMVSYYASSSEPAMVRGKTVYIQYSNRHEIVNNKSPGDIPGNVLLVTIEGVEAGDVSIDVIHLVFSAFGIVHKIATFEKTAGFQALIQFTDAEIASSARDALDGRSIPRYLLPAHVGSCNLRISYSAHKDLNIKFQSNRSRDYTNPMLPVNYTAIEGTVQTAVGPDGKRKEPESNVLLASIENMQYAVTVDVLHTVFSAFGTVQKIAIFEKNGQTQALIQYPDVITAAAAREALEGHCIYDGGYCKLHLSYSRHTDLNVKAFSDKSRDYTVPDPSLLAAQGPATAWQNHQAAPMYPGSAPAFQTQVPGGQVPLWDPSLQAVRPSYVSAPGTYPVQTGAPYAPASMPSASSPLAQSSPIAHNANPMGIAQPSGASLSVPGSSPLMQTSQAAQGLIQPNARPGGASPPGQHYYG